MNTTIKTILIVFVLLFGLFLATYGALYVGVSYIMRDYKEPPTHGVYVPPADYLELNSCLDNGLERLQ